MDKKQTGFLQTNWRHSIMGNMQHRVNMVLVTYMMLAISAYECMASQQKQASFSSDSLEIFSDTQQSNSSKRVELENINGTDTEFRSTWPSVFGAVTAGLSITLLIAVAVKYRLFQSCLPRISHDLLLEEDTEDIGRYTLEGGVPARCRRGRAIHMSGDSSSENDDDGFIEDNYIQASERETAEQEENHQDDFEDIDDELIIPDIE